MKVYLFFPISWVGLIICLVTKSRFSHAAVEIDGVLYDSSETRAKFGKSEVDLRSRPHVVFEFEGDMTEWLASMEGKRYDWKGVMGWIFNKQDKNKFYCFETVWSALEHLKIVGPQPDKVSGKTIYQALKKAA